MTAPAPAPATGTLIFDEAAHTYTVEGVVLPSVTEVLRDVGIIDYGFIPREERDRYLQRGRAVHLATELDDAGELEEDSVDPAVAGFLAAWRRFRSESAFTPSLIEHRGWHLQYRYAGTMDRSGCFGARTQAEIVDIKTGSSPYWCRFQLAAYAAFFDSPRRFPRKSIELHDDGTYRIEEFSCRDWQADFNVFISALTVFRAKRRQ